MKRVLFVCTGNTCRSPMAEALLRHHGEKHFEVQSAGVFAAVGSDASAHAKSALEEKGISIAHASQQVTEELLEWSEVVLTMTTGHKQLLLAHHPEVNGKVHTLYEFVEGTNKDISDPFGGSLAIYKATLEEMEQLVQTLLKNHSES
ncbi:low molecular weight phosphatase family protein [Bacillus sp. AFS018417]|uniref:low molecular weight protein arginine phosphatase n=1 Tax=Bacillus sp. AFS018417 TaxID=2033491 RepID=UPI000BF394D9|nr:low molecular weight protein arginine phosphatase [Bacillus sp. AFS018417]PEZ04242.1 low molecular weight phosphatase family protein [Bacillus sp. AFS018417]